MLYLNEFIEINRNFDYEVLKMKTGIHPEYNEVTIMCACGATYETRSTKSGDIHVEICSKCHPFFTGKQKLVDVGGRVDRFKKRLEKVAK